MLTLPVAGNTGHLPGQDNDMGTVTPGTEAALRRAFKQFNRFMVLLWRLGLGRMINLSPTYGGRMMVLTHSGRKSGRVYRTPVNYAEINGDIYCTAGFGSVSDWYRNALVQPQVELWLPGGRWSAVAEDVSSRPDRLVLLREVLVASGFAARAAGVNPRTMSDSELAEATDAYRLLRLERLATLSGPGGPGDLVWMWPVGGAVLLAVAGLVWRRRGWLS